jgi:hypothetical protein
MSRTATSQSLGQMTVNLRQVTFLALAVLFVAASAPSWPEAHCVCRKR